MVVEKKRHCWRIYVRNLCVPQTVVKKYSFAIKVTKAGTIKSTVFAVPSDISIFAKWI